MCFFQKGVVRWSGRRSRNHDPSSCQDAQKVRPARPQLSEILSVPSWVRLRFDSPAALLDGLFEHPSRCFPVTRTCEPSKFSLSDIVFSILLSCAPIFRDQQRQCRETQQDNEERGGSGQLIIFLARFHPDANGQGVEPHRPQQERRR